MKFIISLSIISMSFLSSASTDVTTAFQSSNSIETALYPGGPGKKKARKGKRTNKKRKRKCAKWNRRSFAG